MTSTGTTHTEPETLRAQLITQLHDTGSLTSPAVRQAMLVVPRHEFLPGVTIADTYANQPVVTKRDTDGASLSSASQPSIVAAMLEQLDLTTNHRVLEIGAGTGYNAALLRELVGPSGQVTTVEIDPQVADQARAALAATGYPDVHVVTGDGALGWTANAPYDRIIITAGAWDLPPAWWNQLTDGGRLVVPLRWRGQTRCVAFDHHREQMVSRSVELCGFIPMQGDDGERTVPLANGAVTIGFDQDQPIDPTALAGVLDQSRHEAWSGVTVGNQDSFDGLWLRMATAEPGTCRIAAQPSAVDTRLATPAIPTRTPAIIHGSSLAYLTLRPCPDTNGHAQRHELGAVGHGPSDLATRFTEHIRAWDSDRTATPTITACPIAAPADLSRGASTIEKRHTRMVFSWAPP
jgi:protein-L-isoaspartate(D-aspartate) O-methyltransferase